MGTKAAAKTLKESLGDKQKRCRQIIGELRKTYPGAKCSLDHGSAFELLVATILSAQCTDERVNLVTPALFGRFADAHAMAKARLPEVEKLVQSTGFYKNKAKALVECSKAIVEKHAGEVPRTLEELTALRGVGRKTANVVLGNVYGVPGVVVDTHVGRLSRRLGFTKQEDPVKVEHELMEIAPRNDWVDLCHLLIYHGRARCTARKPDCLNCELSALCPRIGVTESTERPARAPAKVSGRSLRR